MKLIINFERNDLENKHKDISIEKFDVSFLKPSMTHTTEDGKTFHIINTKLLLLNAKKVYFENKEIKEWKRAKIK